MNPKTQRTQSQISTQATRAQSTPGEEDKVKAKKKFMDFSVIWMRIKSPFQWIASRVFSKQKDQAEIGQIFKAEPHSQNQPILQEKAELHSVNAPSSKPLSNKQVVLNKIKDVNITGKANVEMNSIRQIFADFISKKQASTAVDITTLRQADMYNTMFATYSVTHNSQLPMTQAEFKLLWNAIGGK